VAVLQTNKQTNKRQRKDFPGSWPGKFFESLLQICFPWTRTPSQQELRANQIALKRRDEDVKDVY